MAEPVALSVIILTLNEAENIERCIESTREIADDILVVDSYSSDATEAICRRCGVRFVRHRFEGFIEQRNWALTQTVHPWVLALEGDEALSPTLRNSIREVTARWTHDAYCFNRLSNYCGSWIRHSGWYPDRKLRLFDKRAGQFGGTNPHDRFILKPGATTRVLEGDLLHFAFSSISEHMALANHYADLKAANLLSAGRRASWLNLVFNPLFKFMRDYFMRGGFLDGFHGLVICTISAQANFLKYAKLKELTRTADPSPQN